MVLNSYHEGYRWTDDIVEGVNSVFGPEAGSIEVDFEYMDTKRETDPGYLESLCELYRHKFRDNDYDLVLCSDETAFGFMKGHHDELFPETPVVFCGLNHFDDAMLADEELFTGVVEDFDVGATLAVMLRLHPDCRKIYVVNDDTPTGHSIAIELEEVIPEIRGVEFTKLSGLSMEELQTRVSELPEGSLILFLVFFRDAAGRYFSYDESIEKISSSSSVPVYGIWDFNLGRGIVGGMLTSGYMQGRMAAKLARKVLEGAPPASLHVIREKANAFAFDDMQLKRFGIERAVLPPDSRVINESFSRKKRLLVLHSYDAHMSWVRKLDEGIDSVLGRRQDVVVAHDYMDFKRYPSEAFAQRVVDLFKEKYEKSRFDAILVCDDRAYQFLLAYGDLLFPATPVVFCGVNDFRSSQLRDWRLFTGIVETINVKQTLDLALKLHPGVRNIVVINDRTDVGRTNRKMLDDLMPDYTDRVNFVFFEDMNMSDVRERVSGLGSDSLILLLSFNKDRSNNVFSYDDSIQLIAEKARVPIYGIWDFYLGHGLLGGLMTSGFSQGEAAARMSARILDGEAVSELPVVTESPNRYMFDDDQLRRFGIDPADLPAGSVLFNRPERFYGQHRRLVWATLLVVAILGAAVVMMGINIRKRKRMEDQLRHYATTDEMTGVLNRRTGLLMLEQQLSMVDRDGRKLCVCFADLNNLKEVNDRWGHDRGDQVILALCHILQDRIRSSDILCRLGGDEFLVIFPGCSLNASERIWGCIERNISRYNEEERKKGSMGRVSVSHGFAEYDPREPVSIDDLVRTADQAMYREKEIFKAKGS